MTKLEAVMLTKRANNRLKIVGDTCYQLARSKPSPENHKQLKSLLARIDRELKPKDAFQEELTEAVTTFCNAYKQQDNEENLRELASKVYEAVRNVQSQRWISVKKKHGKVSHYFNRFGQVRKHYRQRFYLKYELERLKKDNEYAKNIIPLMTSLQLLKQLTLSTLQMLKQ